MPERSIEAEATCSVTGCDRGLSARGWCGTHYQAWQRHGDPLGGGRKASSPEEAFNLRTDRQGDCIVWTGSVNRAGYGSIRVEGRLVKAHRYAWEREHGEIPEGLFVDHICWNRACVNVDHLRLATPQQNGQYRERSMGKTGVRGVTESKYGYRARVKHNGRYHSMNFAGRTPESLAAAGEWAEAKRAEIFGEFAGGRR